MLECCLLHLQLREAGSGVGMRLAQGSAGIYNVDIMKKDSKKSEEKLLFKAILPQTLRIKLHRAEEGGYWARVIGMGCYSQGETLSQLFDILTRAIYAYYDVPERLIPELGKYIPADLVRRRISEKRPKRYTLDDILRNNPEKIRELQRIS